MDPSSERPAGSLPSTVRSTTLHEIVLKKSRFITRLSPVASVQAADEVVGAVRKEHWDARHSCVALVVGPHADQQRSSDDGEPSGTAGIPMLEVLRHRNMTDVVAVVTRYFGGVLLGAGGLVRAYSSSVSEALDRAEIVRREVMVTTHVDVPHSEAGRLGNMVHEWCTSHGAILEDTEYGEVVRFRLLLLPRHAAAFLAFVAAASAGGVTPVLGEERIVDVPTGSSLRP